MSLVKILLQLFEKPGIFRLHTGVPGALTKAAEKLLLLPGQLCGRFHHHGDQLISPGLAVDKGDALAPKAEDRAGLGALGNGIADLPVQGGDL